MWCHGTRHVWHLFRRKKETIFFFTHFPLGQLYIFCISRMFLQNTPRKIRNTHYTLFIFHECREKINHEILWLFAQMLTLMQNAAECKKRKKARETRKKLCEIPSYTLSFFIFCDRFHIFHNKYIAGRKENTILLFSKYHGNDEFLKYATYIQLSVSYLD